MKNISILLFVFAICIIANVYGAQKNAAKPVHQATKFHFRNGLSNKKGVKVRCTYGTRNFSDQLLKPGGPDSIMGFHNRSTLLSCVMTKGPDYKISSKFDAYTPRMPGGTSYIYLAKDDGVYFSNLFKFKPTKKFNWI